MRIVVVSPDSEVFKDVVALGDSNSSTLGFFPRKAFEQKANDGQIIAAVTEEGTSGYLLFSYNWQAQIAYIVHLCVAPKQRQKGIAKRLFQEFEEIIGKKVGGIRVLCRTDYEAQAVWPRLGFYQVGEKRGRSKQGSTLTIWRKYTECPDLFHPIQEKDTVRIRAGLDYNVLADTLKAVSESTSGAHAIMEDWLAEMVDLYVTPEIANEANRDKESNRKNDVLQLMQRFEKCRASSSEFEDEKRSLKGLFGTSEQEQSDLSHLAWCAVARIGVFVTNDNNLCSKNTEVYDRIGVQIVRPSDLVLWIDSLLRSTEYQPRRFSESELRIRLFENDDWRLIESLIAVNVSESRKSFERRLRDLLAKPRDIKTQLLFLDSEVLSLISWGLDKQQRIVVHLLRVVPHALSETIVIGIINWLLKNCLKLGANCLKIIDKNPSQSTITQCHKFGFQFTDNALMRWVPTGRYGFEDLQEELNSTELRKNLSVDYCKRVADKLQRAFGAEDTTLQLEVEKDLWPLKISELNLPTYIVSIKPGYAMHLFDHGIARRDLFGGDARLLLNYENAYYRTARGRRFITPARILWYVTYDYRYPKDTMAVRAVSYMNEVHVDKGQPLFGRFQNLGVYKWPDIRATIKEDPERELMAFVFSHCEMFKRPVIKVELERIWQTRMNKKFFVRQPIKISNDLFWEIYDVGMNLLEENSSGEYDSDLLH